jgi:hypothetical protein
LLLLPEMVLLVTLKMPVLLKPPPKVSYRQHALA